MLTNGILTSELLLIFEGNLFVIWLYSYCFYFRRHRDQQMMFLLLALNLFLFTIIELNTNIDTAFGFTLFAVLALVRVRSETVTKTEVAYLLGAISLALVNATLSEFGSLLIANLLILLVVYIGDHPSMWGGGDHVSLRLAKLSPDLLLDTEQLQSKLSEQLNVHVVRVKLDEIRIDGGEVRATIYYRRKE